jgi:hypothetical protein
LADIHGTLGQSVWHVTGTIGIIETQAVLDSTITATSIGSALLGTVQDTNLSATGAIGDLSVTSWTASNNVPNQIDATSRDAGPIFSLARRSWRWAASMSF